MAGTQWSWHQRVRWLITLRVEIAAEGTRGRAFLINYHIICSLCYILNPNGGALAFFARFPRNEAQCLS